jgi:hypothetical protein
MNSAAATEPSAQNSSGGAIDANRQSLWQAKIVEL